jgi:hypothetical protein
MSFIENVRQLASLSPRLPKGRGLLELMLRDAENRKNGSQKSQAESERERRERYARQDEEAKTIIGIITDHRRHLEAEPIDNSPAATARRILAAGEKARTPTSAAEFSEPTGLAAAIVAAGKKRRGEL